MAVLQPVAVGLTDYQMYIVRSGAAKVPHEHRSRFLELLADRLLAAGELSDERVLDTAASILAEMILPN